MREHPYEFGGILFAIAIIAGIFGGVVGNELHLFDGFEDYLMDADNSVHEYVKSTSQPAGSGTDYYKDNMDYQLDCKKASKTLQEFYDCVNSP